VIPSRQPSAALLESDSAFLKFSLALYAAATLQKRHSDQ